MHIPGNSPLSPVNVKTFPFPSRVPVNLPTVFCSFPLVQIHSKIPPNFARYITYLSLGLTYPSSLIIQKICRLSQWSAVLYPTAFVIFLISLHTVCRSATRAVLVPVAPAIRSLFYHRPTRLVTIPPSPDKSLGLFTPCLVDSLNMNQYSCIGTQLPSMGMSLSDFS